MCTVDLAKVFSKEWRPRRAGQKMVKREEKKQSGRSQPVTVLHSDGVICM